MKCVITIYVFFFATVAVNGGVNVVHMIKQLIGSDMRVWIDTVYNPMK